MRSQPRRAGVRSADELAALLRSRPGRVRLVGGGSRQDELPDPGDALHVDLSALSSIVRLDAPDQTCTVECGVPRKQLDAELARVGLELPCPGTGTIGGLFASDAIGAATAGGHSPRTLLLGIDAVLADGTPFRSGARVVKSVAGFDVHKLLVGSRGRLFAATRLHLRLKPRPRAEQWFARSGLDANRAWDLLTALRREPVQPAAVQVYRDAVGAFVVRGRIAGRASFVAAMMRRHELPENAPCWSDHLPLPKGGEVLAGHVLPSALPKLLPMLPSAAPFLWHGGGRFETALPSATASDAALAQCVGAGIHATVARGVPARRGHGTALDPGLQQLLTGMHRALDPGDILA
ncbi:MAG: FAD-binding oxidoreductase [Planctomycetota bacterium]